MKLRLNWLIGIALVAIILSLLSTQYVFAQAGTKIADTQCGPEKGKCAYQQLCDKTKPKTPDNTGILGKVCKDPRGVTGTCIAFNDCKATSAVGSNGKSVSVGDLSSLLSGIAGIMKALGGGAPAGAPPAPTTGGAAQGCPQYYAVSTPSSDPCAYYVPSSGTSPVNIDTGSNTNTNTNDSSGASNSISNLISSLLGGGSSGGTDTGTTTGATSSPGNVSGGVSSSTVQGATGIGSGATGDIRVLPNGATIVITNQNTDSNTVVAGFLGAQATGGVQPAGIAASWCHARPWASNFLSFIIPATFFDSLCTLRGFQVGDTFQGAGPAEIGTRVTLTQGFPATQNATTAGAYQPIATSPSMQVDIWAVPAAVPLGGRTTIFWNSKNAASCTETSPDGSFSHTTLSGGGATVPLSGATVFTISCSAPDGTHATHDVMVNLAL